LTKEWKEKEQDEEVKNDRRDVENRRGGEGMSKVEERLGMIEEGLERQLRDTEEKWRESEERLKNMEEKLEREVNRRMEEDGEGEECAEDRRLDGVRQVEKEDRGAHARIDKLEADMARDRIERQDFEWNEKEEKEIQDTKDSEREMEEKLEGAMEQMKILNLDFGRQCTDRRTLVKEAIGKIREKIVGSDKEDFDRIMKGTRVGILGKETTIKETGKGMIHTVPVLITCGCRNVKERLEVLMRKAGVNVSFQWPKESMDFVDKIREEVNKMGYDRKEYFTRVRPVMVEGRVFLRAEVKKKDGGRFESLAYWRAPPRDKEYWKRISKLAEPEWRIVKKSGHIGP
jgi:hypothetical protein